MFLEKPNAPSHGEAYSQKSGFATKYRLPFSVCVVVLGMKNTPKFNLFLIRHGESLGNVDKTVYTRMPDYAVPLTEAGRAQARWTARDLRRIIGEGEKAEYYVSPFWRTRQTQEEMEKYIPSLKVFEDSRLREQEWGQIDGTDNRGYREYFEEQRNEYGHYHYRFPNGESCAMVEDRVQSFLTTLAMNVVKKGAPDNVILVTHAMTIRVFLKVLLNLTVDEFELLNKPENAEFFTFSQVGDELRMFSPLKMDKQRTHKWIYNKE